MRRFVTVLVLLVLVMWSGFARSQTTEAFGSRQTINGQSAGAFDIEAADLDGDGDLDVLTGSKTAANASWYENLGGGVFGPEQIIANLVLGADKVAAGDLDGDGDLDVVIVRRDLNEVVWCENLAGGSFGPIQTLVNIAKPVDVAIVDLNGDGVAELLVGIAESGRVFEFFNLGGGMFGNQVLAATTLSLEDFDLADVDGDGDCDVVATGGTGGTVWGENLGGGVFTVSHLITDQVPFSSSVGVADLDGDSDQDVITASGTGLILSVNLGGGVFAPDVVIGNLSMGDSDLELGDLDGDGDEDVLVSSQAGDFVAWIENLGGAVFGPLLFLDTQLDGASAVDLGDLNGDGAPDVLAAAKNDGVFAWFPSHLAFVPNPLVAHGLGAMNERVGESLLGLGDVDGDGVPDVLTGAASWAEARGRVRGWSGATGTVLWTTDGSGAGDRLGSTLARVGDWDGDGFEDVAVGAPGSSGAPGEVRILSAATGAPLAVFDGLQAGDSFGAAVAGGGDWDGDGVADVAVGAPDFDFFGVDSGYVRVYSGSNGAALALLYGGTPGGGFGRAMAAVPDRDGDGRDEWLIARHAGGGSGELVVVSGGVGAPLDQWSESGGGPDWGAALAADRDLDGDGVPEIIVGDPSANGGAGAVWVYDGASFALLRSHTGSPGSQLGHAVAFVGDLNGDGQGDYLLGAPGFTNADGVRVGRIRGFDGGAGGDLQGALGALGLGPEAFEGLPYSDFGAAIAGTGDLDGDGYAEFVVGLPLRHRAWVFGGLNPAGLHSVCAQGTADEPLLLIDGSSGGPPRRVTTVVNTPFTLSVNQPSTNPSPANFAVAGYIGVPQPGTETTLPYGLGTLCLPPLGSDPATFLLTNNFASFVSQLVTSTPAPWTLTVSQGIPVPFDLVFQGVVVVAPGDLRITNAVLLSVGL